jgi:dUTP pyrophosphatase
MSERVSGLGGALGREELLRRIQGTPPLISDYNALDEQLQPNGFDLSLAEVGRFVGPGAIGRSNAERELPAVEPLPFDADGWLALDPGVYQVVFNEIVDLPNGLMALGRPRSSLCRAGATLHTAVWDAGYRGRSTSMLVVANRAGLRLARDARLLQLVFFTLNAPTKDGYAGNYQGENIPPAPSDRPDQSRRA